VLVTTVPSRARRTAAAVGDRAASDVQVPKEARGAAAIWQERRGYRVRRVGANGALHVRIVARALEAFCKVGQLVGVDRARRLEPLVPANARLVQEGVGDDPGSDERGDDRAAHDDERKARRDAGAERERVANPTHMVSGLTAS
jgi:hypothetical protein